MEAHRPKAQRVDRALAALIGNLKERGLLQDTLVAICTEFGRTPWVNDPGGKGRNHYAKAFTCLLAGAGVKGGNAHGETNEYGAEIVSDPVHVHDYHATILHLLGIDHTRLTYRYSGRDFRLTDVSGRVVTGILARLYGNQGQYAKEEDLAHKAFQLCKDVLGDEHPYTLQSMTTLAHAYVSQRKAEKAEELLRGLLDMSRGERFWEISYHLRGMRSLASAYQRQGDWASSEKLYAVLVQKVSPGRGGTSLRRDRVLVGLGESLLRQGKHAEAEPHLRDCHILRQQKMPYTRCLFEAMSLLGRSLAGPGKLAEAEPVLLDGFKGMVQRESEVLAEDPDESDRKLSLAEAAGWIVEIYEGWGKKDEAAKWRTNIEEAKILERKP